jgi:predicted nucleotidyltransferase component of viral defense system
MSKKSSLSASVKQRLLNFAKEKGEVFNFVLTRYALERLLYRLSVSPYKDKFLLKGAFLFTVWFDVIQRPTRDLDLLGFGAQDIAGLEKIFVSLCKIESEDGLIYLAETVKGGEIREGEEYQGVRLIMTAMLGKARIPLQIDVGFGDAVIPQPQEETIPVILDFAAPKLKIYPKYTVVAEKFEAMVKLGIANSRLKDFWDLRFLANKFEFDGEVLQQAITATFARRRTKLPLIKTNRLDRRFRKRGNKTNTVESISKKKQA